MARQFWNTIRQVIRIGKIPQSLTIPAATYTVFRTDGCIEYTIADANDNRFSSSIYSATTSFTAEMMFKPLSNIGTKQVLIKYGDAGFGEQFEISLLNNVLSVRVWKATVATTVSAIGYVTNYEWNHVALSYDNATIRIYINGILRASGALVGPADSFLGFAHIGQSEPTTEQFVGRIAEIRVWTVTRTADQIFGFYNKPRNASMDDVTGLIDYYKLNGVSLDGSGREQNQIDNARILNASSSKLIHTDTPPLIFGGSFTSAEFALSITAPLSFHFPVTIPTGCTGMLVIRWTDSNGVVQRRRFWDLDGVDINPFPATYSGERVSITNTALEWWNIDGNQTLVVPSAITLRVSNCTNPTFSVDATAISLATLTEDTTLGEPYPLTYPLTFNTAQTYT